MFHSLMYLLYRKMYSVYYYLCLFMYRYLQTNEQIDNLVSRTLINTLLTKMLLDVRDADTTVRLVKGDRTLEHNEK